MSAQSFKKMQGFTLIEVSIVLVIIGLIAGGILVGRDMIEGAAIRSQLTQIEKYKTAVNTFRLKYGYLPGDIPATPAMRFGFAARGMYAGEGDGNGIMEGNYSHGAGGNNGTWETSGEDVMLWVDLQAAQMIDRYFLGASATQTGTFCLTPNIDTCFPEAKIGSGNYVYVYSGVINSYPTASTGINYFGLSIITVNSGYLNTSPGLTVAEASSMDTKMDDGTPQTGKVTASYLNNAIGAFQIWVSGGSVIGASPGSAATASATTCYANGGNAANAMQYSTTVNGGEGLNCALSFRF